MNRKEYLVNLKSSHPLIDNFAILLYCYFFIFALVEYVLFGSKVLYNEYELKSLKALTTASFKILVVIFFNFVVILIII